MGWLVGFFFSGSQRGKQFLFLFFFLVVGGVDAAGRFLDTAELVEMSNPGSCQVTRRETVGVLSQGRAAPRLTSLIGGDVLVTGGITRDNGAVVSVGQSEIYVTAR